jgi:hypothetical protein
MIAFNWRKILAPILISVLLLVSACAPQPPSRFEQAQKESTKRGAQPAVAKDATKGGEFNKFFPKSGGGYDRVFTQEKKGFAEAKLKKNGKDVAMLAISDTKSTPSAAAKFQTSTKKIAGYPSVTVGASQTAVLVDGRYQVKVLSRDLVNFKEKDREAWLQKFDLAGLARLSNASGGSKAVVKPGNAPTPANRFGRAADQKPSNAVSPLNRANRPVDDAKAAIDKAKDAVNSAKTNNAVSPFNRLNQTAQPKPSNAVNPADRLNRVVDRVKETVDDAKEAVDSAQATSGSIADKINAAIGKN